MENRFYREAPHPADELAALRTENELLREALFGVVMIFAERPDIYALTGFAERPVIEQARKLVNNAA